MRTRPIRVLVVLLLVAVVPAWRGRAQAEPADAVAAAAEAMFLDAVNRERADAGLAGLQNDPVLTEIARRHSNRMRDAGAIFHNPRLGLEVPKPWAEIGENIGRGTDVAVVDQTFMLSGEHRAHILGNFDRIGVGIALSPRGVYVTQVFVRTG